MAVSEHERHQLYIAVESAIGAEGAATLMQYLPPTGWVDVARKGDLDALEHRLMSKIDTMRAEFYKAQEAQTRLVVFGMITMVVVVAALAFGAARLS